MKQSKRKHTQNLPFKPPPPAARKSTKQTSLDLQSVNQKPSDKKKNGHPKSEKQSNKN